MLMQNINRDKKFLSSFSETIIYKKIIRINKLLCSVKTLYEHHNATDLSWNRYIILYDLLIYRGTRKGG